ncbi:MAG: hypothetical protein ACLSCO_02515 [Gallintestinimicrobium sp.]
MKTYYEIEAYSEKIYIGTDFPGEYAHSKDTKALAGANAKAKANAAQAIGELIRTAVNKSESEDYGESAMEPGHKMAGIVMMSDLDFQYIIRKEDLEQI